MNKTVATTEAPALNLISVIERVAMNPDADIEKMKALLVMKREEEAIMAKRSLNSAMSLIQQDTQVIAANADNPHTKSKYATLAAFDRLLRPVYTKHGMDVGFETGDPIEGFVNLVCVVSHIDGGERRASLPIPVVTHGAKGGDVMTPTHATVSAVSYGKRTLLGMVFNVAVDKDDDGNQAGFEPLSGEELDELLAICDTKGLTDAQREKFCSIHDVKAFAEISRAHFKAAKIALNQFEAGA